MKYWLVGIGILLLSASCDNGSILIQQRCLEVLNRYVTNHPDNITCSNQPDSGIYDYTTSDGNDLKINDNNHTFNLFDKNGNIIKP